MTPSRRRLTAALVAAPMLLVPAFSRLANAQQMRVRPNYEYRAINPQPVSTGDRVEVIEFFWYGCPYCNALQPSMESWLKRKPSDTEFRRIPAVFRQSWVPHARIYYTLETLGELDRLHQTVYRAFHVDKEGLNTTGSTAEWAVKHGIDRARWIATFESAEVSKKLDQAVLATRAYSIEGTPSLVVDGRYVTSTAMSETIEGVIPILDELLVLARERRAAK